MNQDRIGDYIYRGMVVFVVAFLVVLGLVWSAAAAAQEPLRIPLLTPTGEGQYEVSALRHPELSIDALVYLCVRQSRGSTQAACIVIRGDRAIVVPVKVDPEV